MANYRSGDVNVQIALAEVTANGRYRWIYMVSLHDEVIAKGDQLETVVSNPPRAVGEILAFLAYADSEMRQENGWTFDATEFETACWTVERNGFTSFLAEPIK